MNDIFDMDYAFLKKLKRFYRNAPREFSKATAGVLNSLAFTTRKYDINNLKDNLIARNERFISSMIRVEKSRSGPIERQQSQVYSLSKGNFTGWAEQQLGKPTTQKKAFSTAGRQGSLKNKVPNKYRMRRGKKFLRSDSVSPKISRYKNTSHRTLIFLYMMRRRKQQPFFIHEPIGSMRAGLYEYQGTKLRMIAGTKPGQPRRVPWRTMSINQLKNKNNIKDIWLDNIYRVLNKYK